MNILSCLLLICLNNGDTDLYRFRKRIKRIVMTQVFLSGLVDSAYYRMFFMSKEIPGNQFSYIGFRSQGFLWTKGEKGKENASKEVSCYILDFLLYPRNKQFSTETYALNKEFINIQPCVEQYITRSFLPAIQWWQLFCDRMCSCIENVCFLMLLHNCSWRLVIMSQRCDYDRQIFDRQVNKS